MDFDELDSLLDLENELEEGSHKRNLADLHSLHDAVHSLPDSPGVKRTRIDGSGASLQPAADDFDDEELLELAASLPSHTLNTFRAIGVTEEQDLLALAADSQPSLAAGEGHGYSHRTFKTSTGRAIAETEERQLLALAASSQPSQSRAGGDCGTCWAAPQGPAGAAGAAGRATQDEDDFNLDAMLDEMIEEEEGAAAVGTTTASAPAVAVAGGAAGRQQTTGAAQAVAAPEFLLPLRQYVPPAKEVFRISGTSLAITSESGERVYCQLEPAPGPGCAGGKCSRKPDVMGMLRRARGGLLSDSISNLLAAVEKDQYDRAVSETGAAAVATAAAAGTSPAGQQQQRTPGRRRQQNGGDSALGRPVSSLWAQKYAPRSYIDLLSDEQINREVVRWLKGWDPCVFGTAAPTQLVQQARGVGSRYQKHGGFGSSFGAQQQQQQGKDGSAPDALGRPEHRVILIAGPPGLGKTTLAHVCAAHCGYRPVEINASDDRSGASLQAKVLDAVEMQSVMGERRPNCIIIDEIDGASGGAEGRSGIAALIKIVNATSGKPAKQAVAGGGKRQQDAAADGGDDSSVSDAEKEEEKEVVAGGERAARAGGVQGRRGGGAGSGKPHQLRLRPLLRPIICICNDLYAPALRPLRDVARVFTFKKPQAERLAQRLQAICAAEDLRCEKSTLRLLVERTDCDIRSCLNTLQFLSKKQAAVRAGDLAGLRVGQKDMTKGAFAVWGELLQKKKGPGTLGKMAESEAQRVTRLCDMLQDFGESELVMGGMHENMLGLRYFDMALQRTSAVLNHLGDADVFMRCCYRSSEFELLKYVPAPLVLVSGIVAGPDRPQLQWPRAAFEAQRRTATNSVLLQGWMLGMSPATCAAISRRSLLLEVLPALMHIAAPALRPVSRHLYSPIEQETVRQLVDTLLCYNLRYCLVASSEEAEEAATAAAQQQQQQGGADGALKQQPVRGSFAEPPLRFRPAVHRACHFSGIAPTGKLLPVAVRQAISHEADMEAIRQAEASRRGSGSGASPPVAVAVHGSEQALQGHHSQVVSGPVPLTLAERVKAAGTAASTVRKQAAATCKGTWLDALKEQYQAHGAAARGEDGAGGRRHKFPVLYKFHEGYTNAVKRPVLMRELLR